MYSCSIGYILEHEFFCFWAAQAVRKKVDLSYSEQLLRVVFSTFWGQKIKKKKLKSFLPSKKLKKPTSKVAQNNSNRLFFSLLPELPNQPKQKNSCSKMWPIDQLYIELGCKVVAVTLSKLNLGATLILINKILQIFQNWPCAE